jgi:hypothetical protein
VGGIPLNRPHRPHPVKHVHATPHAVHVTAVPSSRAGRSYTLSDPHRTAYDQAGLVLYERQEKSPLFNPVAITVVIVVVAITAIRIP